MFKRILKIAICVIPGILFCSLPIADGGGSEVGNGIVAGVVLDDSGMPVESVFVQIVPVKYNPIEDTALMDVYRDTTDHTGGFCIAANDTGRYNIEAVHTTQQTRALKTNILVQKDSVTYKEITLSVPGAARIVLPDTADTISGYIFIPGTSQFEKLSDETILIGSNSPYIIFDSLPADTLPGIYYAEEIGVNPASILYDSIVITSGDTTILDSIEDNTPLVRGIIFNYDGTPAENAYVHLVPKHYNPAESLYVRADTTDSNGAFVFYSCSTDTYTIQSISYTKEYSGALFNNVVTSKTILETVDTLKIPGGVIIPIPMAFDTIMGYIYASGTTFFEHLFGNIFLELFDKRYVLFELIPAGIIPKICYATFPLHQSVLIHENVDITSNDTTLIIDTTISHVTTVPAGSRGPCIAVPAETVIDPEKIFGGSYNYSIRRSK